MLIFSGAVCLQIVGNITECQPRMNKSWLIFRGPNPTKKAALKLVAFGKQRRGPSMKFSTKGSSCGTTSSFSLQSKGEAGRPFSPLAVNIHAIAFYVYLGFLLAGTQSLHDETLTF